MRVRFAYLAPILFAAALAGNSAWAGRARALGSVVQSNNAMVNNETAMAGADVYACDVLDTDSYGNLRVQFGGSQILLSPSSEAVLDGDPNSVRVIVVSGTTSFSANNSAALEIDTPAGIVRQTTAQPYAGAVTVTGPKELILSAIRGDLVLNNGGELHTVPAGKSARVTFERVANASCHSPGYVRSANDPRKIGFYILAGGGGAAAYFTWKELTESPTKPD